MNRTILFRGKRVDNGEWVGGNYCFIPDVKPPDTINDHYEIYDYFYGQSFEVIPETVSQFTGLYDCNKKMIFENDIVKGRFNTGNIFIRYVKWYNSGFILDFDIKSESYSTVYLSESEIEDFNMCIIGNVFDNPDLLKGGE